MTTKIAVLALAGLLASAGVAKAGDAECAWAALSPQTRATIAALYRQGGLAPAAYFRLRSLEIETLGDRCVRNGADLETITRALFLHAMRDDLAARLRELRLDPAAVETAWRQGFAPAQRATFRRYLQDREIHRPPDASEKAVLAALFDLPQTHAAIAASGADYETKTAIVDYAFVLARLEDAQARF